jgi:hypothetical protein
MKYLLLVLLLACAAPIKDPTNLDLIESIANDPAIEDKAKSQIIAKIVEKDRAIIQSILQENADFKEEIAENKWKVDLVDRIKSLFYWLLTILILTSVGYLVFKFRRLLGSPI